MNFKPVTFVPVSRLSRPRTALQAFFEEVIASGHPMVEVSWQGQYKDADSCAGSLRSTIKKNGYNFEVVNCKGQVFLKHNLTHGKAHDK